MNKKIIAAMLVAAILSLVILQLTNNEPTDDKPIVSKPSAVTVLSSAPADSWTTKTPMPINGGSEAAVVNGKIYVFGSRSNYEYNPANDSWQVKTPMPTPRGSFTVATWENKIYVIGGYTNDSAWGINEVYDPATDSWQTNAAMPTSRSQMNAETVNGKIYVIAGTTGGQFSTSNLTEVYNPVTDSWSTAAPIPHAVSGFGSAVVDNKIYVIGGQAEFEKPMNSGFVQIFDTKTNTWSQGARHPMPAWVEETAVATTGVYAPKRIYVLGGIESFGQGLTQNFAYDTQTDSWSTAASLSSSRASFGVAVVDDLVYAIGGTDGWNAQTLNQQFTPLGYGKGISEPSLRLVVPDDYGDIEAAMDNLAEGGTIYVKNGNYTLQTLNVIKPLSLIGENPEKTIINSSQPSLVTVIKIAADKVQISNFTFNRDWGWGNAIVGHGDNITITQNIFRRFGQAVEVTGANNTIADNTEIPVFD
jgi:N-acetylneuraminic acid mutarotase